MEADLIFCDNCRTKILSEYWAIHSVTCARHKWYCKECDIVCPVSKKDEHNTEYHTLIKCACGWEMSPHKYKTHTVDECDLRVLPCIYCECPLPANTLEEHQDWCGSRTEACELCDKRVQLRHLEDHVCSTEESPTLEPEPTTNTEKIECPFCIAPIEDYVELQMHIFDTHPEILTE